MSPWNDVEALDELLPRGLRFIVSILNTITLGGDRDEQKAKLLPIQRVSKHRKVSLVAQAIQRIPDTYEETFARLDGFLCLAREVLYQLDIAIAFRRPSTMRSRTAARCRSASRRSLRTGSDKP